MLASLEKMGARAALAVADLMEVEACRGVIQTAMDTFGGVDILVCSAALDARARRWRSSRRRCSTVYSA